MDQNHSNLRIEWFDPLPLGIFLPIHRRPRSSVGTIPTSPAGHAGDRAATLQQIPAALLLSTPSSPLPSRSAGSTSSRFAASSSVSTPEAAPSPYALTRATIPKGHAKPGDRLSYTSWLGSAFYIKYGGLGLPCKPSPFNRMFHLLQPSNASTHASPVWFKHNLSAVDSFFFEGTSALDSYMTNNKNHRWPRNCDRISYNCIVTPNIHGASISLDIKPHHAFRKICVEMLRSEAMSLLLIFGLLLSPSCAAKQIEAANPEGLEHPRPEARRRHPCCHIRF
ncbi:hypothetical protein SETIT_9G373800v2 [Setaria italica]|uniref:Uncharacterized protein n=1 Tax=Setaria italica TaxID=4555 RepID=A0A368SPS7_SETIT|nr:hypothetical protein SETIT_9G373800v2 [Setaria italica]